MTPFWTAVIVAVSGLVGAAIGAGTGVLIVRRKNDELLHSIRAAHSEGRRAAAYLEVAVGWHGYLQTLRPLAFPEEGFSSSRPRDLAAVLRSRAQLELFGTTSVQQLHDEALEEAVTLINVLRSTPKTPTTGAPDISAQRYLLRFVLGEISKKVDALERQMNRELQPRTALREQSVEVAGRPLRVGHDAVVGESVSRGRRR